MRPRSTPLDLLLALAMTLLGGLFLYFALRRGFKPHELTPGVEGALGAGVLGATRAVLHPMELWRAVLFSTPVLAIEVVVVSHVDGPVAGVVALHLIIVGFVGLALGLRDPGPDEEEDEEPAERA
jgi:hypothetical protein